MLTTDALRDFLEFLQRWAALIGSILTLGATIFSSLNDKANPPVVTLSIFSLLTLLICIWLTFGAPQSGATPESDKNPIQRYSAKQIASAWVVAVAMIVGLWSFVYREHIAYSALAGRIFGGQRIVVSKNVAWQVLKSPTDAGVRAQTLIGELADVLSGLPYRITVMDLTDFQATERDTFIVDGLSEALHSVIKVQMVFTVPRVETLIQQVTAGEKSKNPDDKEKPVLPLPAKRFVRNQFLFSQFQLEVPLSGAMSGEVETTLTRLVLRYGIATMLFYDGNRIAGRIFRQILDIGKLLPALKNKTLVALYKATAYYLFTHENNVNAALEAIQMARSFAPEPENEAELMAAYILLSSGEMERAGSLVTRLNYNDDPAIVDELKGEYYFAVQQYPKAIAAYTAALAKEHDASYLAFLHLAIALAYARSEDDKKAPHMIAHLEDSRLLVDRIEREGFKNQLRPSKHTLLVLQGYAWSLQGNAERTMKTFDVAASLEKDDEHKNFRMYWLGNAMFQLKQFPNAVEKLKALVGPPSSSGDPGLLLMLAKNLMNIPGHEEDAEAYLDRALELKSSTPEVYLYKGLGQIARAMKSENEQQRQELNDQALDYLLRSVTPDDERASTHELVAALYDQAKDSVNADKHRLRSCELEPKASRCVIQPAEQLVSAGKYEEALKLFAEIRQANPTNADISFMEGVNWQRAGRLQDAKAAYLEAIRRAPESFDPYDNLAFVLFDLGSYKEALKYWEKALTIDQHNPDALAGKAIALLQLSKRTEARMAYKGAIDRDKSYLDCNILRERFSWSDGACSAAAPLIGEMKHSFSTM